MYFIKVFLHVQWRKFEMIFSNPYAIILHHSTIELILYLYTFWLYVHILVVLFKERWEIVVITYAPIFVFHPSLPHIVIFTWFFKFLIKAKYLVCTDDSWSIFVACSYWVTHAPFHILSPCWHKHCTLSERGVSVRLLHCWISFSF